jgi:hypothetical protein
MSHTLSLHSGHSPEAGSGPLVGPKSHPSFLRFVSEAGMFRQSRRMLIAVVQLNLADLLLDGYEYFELASADAGLVARLNVFSCERQINESQSDRY